MQDLDGKVAVVTGAGGGIGLATARALGRQGMKVVLAGRTQATLEEAASACRADGLTVLPVTADVSDFAAMQRLADTAYDAFGQVHLLNLNAAIAGGEASLLDADTASWHTVVDVNLLGVVWGIKAFLPRMREANQEALVLATTSAAGSEGTCYRASAYAATKLAVVSLMESLHGLLRDEQSLVRAGIVVPPLTATGLSGGPAAMKRAEQYQRSQGIPNTLVEPEPVAEMVVDGIRRGRFFIRAGRAENERFFDSAYSPEFFEWRERMVRGRAQAQLDDDGPDGYLW